ncbi:tRNA (adenosine(37)-N6)-threonylcarbamoyltransferase complex dimerization subunit type 1 TsaB [bacterium]|nr:tRNA (adenosine(37)-N6)-threonylcarbamoyltransferase complex dimerization subunit type 1 TsaB [bacterium]
MPPETLVLAFDTSAAHCAAALLSDDRVLAHRTEPMEKGQAERLLPLLEEMLAGAGLVWRDLDLLAVGTGPGNFTGVRIAVAAARGLALGLKIPAVGVTALEAMAHGIAGDRVALMDARRGLIYAQVFDGGSATLCTADTLPDLPAGLTCIGHDAARVASRCQGRVAEPAFPLTVAMARIARTRTLGAIRPAPFYLRGADAAPPSDPPPVILP